MTITLACSTLAQGVVRFENLVFAFVRQEAVDVPFYDDSGVFLTGPNYVAQLFYWQHGSGFVPVGDPVAFDVAGYFHGGSVVVPSPYQGPAWVQVRAWDARSGATFEDTTMAGGWSGNSAPLYLPMLGTPTVLGRRSRVTVARTTAARETTPPRESGPPVLSAILHGLQYPGPPVIVRGPESKVAPAGTGVTLSVVASRGVGVTYQWFQEFGERPDGLIPGATNATYSTAPLSANATFWVTVSNEAGTTTSKRAVITVEGAASTSRLLTPEVLRDKTVIGLEGEPGIEYEVQYRDQADAGTWKPLGRVAVSAGMGGRATIIDNDVAGVPHRFYRAVVVP